MPHIALPEIPGIMAMLTAFPEVERPLNQLTNHVMCGPSSLTRGERELIATAVSNGNECYFCTSSHAAVTRTLLGDEARVVDELLEQGETCHLTPKMQALVAIALKVRQSGKLVTADEVQRARDAGADDQAIHDTVLIAAMFCMFNRYVDGLATTAPRDPEFYKQTGQRVAQNGYGSTFRERTKAHVEGQKIPGATQ
jgi:uncharacterized peroxidase-related enzyme